MFDYYTKRGGRERSLGRVTLFKKKERKNNM
jgi:hypothetical protein